ncbi:hypothetical protein OHA37_38975 [Streptomyces sp. NBC_00335]|uniref:hypothetical protein n=1 Tax=unclassified Streptomyces TaxID=2593676 RepID=UPI0022517AF5|nr:MULTISPECIES: hypothetical protein [unclassified Streptomyces]MCX5409817.1 hypothetical protein [Streptomyces sp. NBC_00086]
MDQNVAAGLVEEWLAGPNSEASGHFSYQAVEHYRPAVLHWLTVGCGAESGLPNPELHLRPTPAALQEWAVGYAGAARSRDACGAVRSFYRWLETPAGAGGPGLVPIGTARSLQFQRGGNFAAGLLGRELWTPDQCRWLAQAADRYQGTRREGPHRARALVYLCLNHYLGGRSSEADVLRPGQIAAMRLRGRHQEQHRTTWDVPQKNAASDATRLQPVHHDGVRAIDEYLPQRAAALPDTGHLFTTVNGRPLEPQSLLRILRSVAATHPDLEEAARTLSADAVTHSAADPARPAAGSSADVPSAGGTRA